MGVSLVTFNITMIVGFRTFVFGVSCIPSPSGNIDSSCPTELTDVVSWIVRGSPSLPGFCVFTLTVKAS